MTDVRLVPSHPRALDDLATFCARARRADPDGAARLQSLDLDGRAVLTVTVAPLGGAAGLPVVLGLRVLALEEVVALDATVPLAALVDRLARDREVLPVPPTRVLTAAWAGVSPPRGGWSPAGEPSSAVLVRAAADGAAHVVRGAERAAVWSAPVPGTAGLPAGAALAADVLGFLQVEGGVPLARSGPWWRLSTRAGHVLARSTAALLR